MDFKNLLFKESNGIGLLTLNRPDKLNALNAATLSELESLLKAVGENEDIKVLIITGAGEKAFIAGADIKELSECNEKTGKDFALRGQAVFNLIENLGKPVIAAVNGFALGGGCELALSCHIRIASAAAKFGQPEVNLGIIPGYGGTQRLARLINFSSATEYILTGDLIDSSEALRIGLISRIHAPDELLDKVYELAEKIAGKGQAAVKLGLESLINTKYMSLEEGLKNEAALFGECCATEDFNEGTSAFLEKRKPEFRNK